MQNFYLHVLTVLKKCIVKLKYYVKEVIIRGSECYASKGRTLRKVPNVTPTNTQMRTKPKLTLNTWYVESDIIAHTPQRCQTLGT